MQSPSIINQTGSIKNIRSTIKRTEIVKRVLSGYSESKRPALLNSLIWHQLVDFDKFYLKLLNISQFQIYTILYGVNCFYRVVEWLDRHQIDYRADAGTLLGAVKWDGFILHDVDYDLVLNKDQVAALLKNSEFKKFLVDNRLTHTTKYSDVNKCGTVSIQHAHIPVNIDLYGLAKKNKFYHLCHYNVAADDIDKMYNVMEDEWASPPSKAKFGEISLKTYSKEKVIQYLNRTYWFWNDLVYVRAPSYYENKIVAFCAAFIL